MTSNRYVVGKRRCIFNSFSENCRFYPLRWQQNSINSFLKVVMWNLTSLINKHSVLCYIKNPLVYLASWTYFCPCLILSHQSMVILEMVQWIRQIFQMLTHFIIQYHNLICYYHNQSTLERSFNVAKLSRSQWQIQDFQISNFNLKAWIS